MHWNLGHFAAIVKESNGPYQIEDPTFWRQYGAPQMISPLQYAWRSQEEGK